jgi:hypothetical protein
MNPWDDPEIKLQRQLIAQGREESPELGVFGTLWTYAWTAASVLIAAGIIFALLGEATHAFRSIWTATKSDLLRALLGTAIVAATAASLYWLRIKRLLFYGMLEVAFGLASTARACITVSGKATVDVLVIMAGCVYLVVRGLDNYFRGRAEPRRVAPSAK